MKFNFDALALGMEFIEVGSKKETKVAQDRLVFLDNFRAIAIIMVVGVHTLDYCIPLPEPQNTIISFIVKNISVPVFFFVDGYLFARSIIVLKNNNYINRIKKSTVRLLVPWVFFTLFYVIVRYFFELTGLLQDNLIVGHSVQNILLRAYGSVYAPQMYFLMSLFIIRLMNPVFVNMIDGRNYISLFLSFIIWMILYKLCINFFADYISIKDGQEPFLHALWGLQYYFFGIIVFKLSRIFDIKRTFIYILIIFFGSLYIYYRNWVHLPFIVQYSYMMTMFILFVKMDKGAVPCWLTRLFSSRASGHRLFLLNIIGKNTMGIYLLHAPVILKAVSLVLNQFILIPTFSFFAILFSTCFFSLCIIPVFRLIPYGSLLIGEPYQRA